MLSAGDFVGSAIARSARHSSNGVVVWHYCSNLRKGITNTVERVIQAARPKS